MSDFDDPEDNKYNVRSTIDALGEMCKPAAKKRGRPRKYTLSSRRDSPVSSSRRRSPSRASSESEKEEVEEDDEEEEVEAVKPKRKRRESDDDEWDEEQEQLTVAQRRERRTRKKPTLYSEESVVSEQRRRQQTMSKRTSNGSTGHRKGKVHLPANCASLNAHHTSMAVIQGKFSKEEKEELEKMRQQWRDMEYPMQAKMRLLPMLRRGEFEKCLELITPTIEMAKLDGGNIPDGIMTIFGSFTCSAGFLEFLKNVRIEACVAFYDICDKLYVLSDLPDNAKIAQALRFWWNSLSFKSRRQWERHARNHIKEMEKDQALDRYLLPCAKGYEVPIMKHDLTEERRQDELRWEEMRSKSLLLLEETEKDIGCPLCEKDEEPCRMGTMREIQEHFFHHHWQVHGYACHLCGKMFSTEEELYSDHTDCEDWLAFNANRILAGKSRKMAVCRMMLCCADCGWYTNLNGRYKRGEEEAKINSLRTFFAHHNNEGLLSMMIYFAATPTIDVTMVKFPVTSTINGDPLAHCEHCGPSVTFNSPAEANRHYMKEHQDKALSCGECHARAATKYLFNQHQMLHVHDNSYFADFLSNSARVFPPPTNMSCTARSGWYHRENKENYSFGGAPVATRETKGYDLVDSMEDVRERKARLIEMRRNEGKVVRAGGYDNAEVEEETNFAKKIREKLKKKYRDCDGVSQLLDSFTWFRDEDALTWQDWMDYWESPDGVKQGGPPKRDEIFVEPTAVENPRVEVELHLKDIDFLSGYLLNENVFYCLKCDSILKGEQADEHLKLTEMMEDDDESKKSCAFDCKGLQPDPNVSHNMFKLFSYESNFAPNIRLPCPHCPVKGCSITGLRVHIMEEHARFVKYSRVEDEKLKIEVPLKFDIRTQLAKRIDEKLEMKKNGLLPQRFPPVNDVAAIHETTWANILPTRENMNPNDLLALQQLIEEDRVYATMPTAHRPVPAFLASRRAQQPPRLQQLPRYATPVIMQNPQHRTLEQSLQHRHAMQQLQQQPQTRHMNNMATPIARQQMVRGLGGGQYQRPIGASSVPRIVKLVSDAVFGMDRRGYVRCHACNNSSVEYEPELLKAHITRCHMHTCGHCTALFVYEPEAKKHAKKCRAEKNQHYYHPDPRLPHIKARCPFYPMCLEQTPMVQMGMHLIDRHLHKLEFETPSGRLKTHIVMIEERPPVHGKEPEVERLRYKYYPPQQEMAKNQHFHQCHVCGLFLPDVQKLQLHLRLHPEYSYFCWLCPRQNSAALGTITAIIKHINEYHLPNPKDNSTLIRQSCPNCQRNIANRELQHLMYECEHNFMCTLCRDLPMFENVTQLKDHKEKCHYDSIRRFECSHCTAFFATTQDFMRHQCDPMNTKTNCACGASFKTRKLYTQHFQQMHIRGQSCTICYLRFAEGNAMMTHHQIHGKMVRAKGIRHMLMCAYGKLNGEIQWDEVKSLFTVVSNGSMKLRAGQGLFVPGGSGGSPETPLTLSDDDDVIALDSSAVQREREQAAAAAAHVPMQQLNNAAAAAIVMHKQPVMVNGSPLTDEDIAAEVLRAVVDKIVQNEETARRHSAERRGSMQAASRNDGFMELPENVLDDDCIMLDDDDVVATPSSQQLQQGQRQELSAHVREEAMDTTTSSVGGRNLPGYQEDDDLETAAAPAAPVVRQFEPDDDELCIVTEIENTGCSVPAAISKQREKKFACTKCSSRFMTQKRLTDHLRSAHQFDAGETTIHDELGIPVQTALWICKSCCLAFQTIDQKKVHQAQHGGQRPLGCEHCSCVAYNPEVMSQHQRKVQENRISYVCGECKFEFEHETNLHEHSRDKHNTQLIYFCKACEVGSTEGVYIYEHFMSGVCPSEINPIQRTQEHASKRIGVCPANQLHFQPISMDSFREALARVPHRFVKPSLCSHRSLIVAGDRQVSCKECRCLENMQRHVAMLSSEDDAVRRYELTVARVRTLPPLTSLRAEYEAKRGMDMRRNQAHMAQQMAYNPNARYPGAGAPHMQMMQQQQQRPPPGYQPRQVETLQMQQERMDANRRMNERIHAAQMAARGGTTMNGAMAPRPPMLTPGTITMHNGHIVHNGGAAIHRQAMGPPPHRLPVQQLQQQHTLPVLTRAPLSTMGSLQSIAAMAGGGGGESTSSSSNSNSPAPAAGSHCNHCASPLLSQRDVFIHSLHTPERGAFVCSVCPVAIKDEKSAIKHIVNHMEQNERRIDMDMECPFPECQVEIPTMIMLKAHLVAHNPPLRHRVKGCHISFGSAALAAAHAEVHNKSDRDNECCVLCGTMDNWEAEMTDRRGHGHTVKHMMKHAMKHKYYCKICDMKTFDKESQMVTHFVMFHTSAEDDYRSCSGCNEKLRTDNEHKTHCLTKHTITELFKPKKMVIRIPQEFSDYIGVGMDE